MRAEDLAAHLRGKKSGRGWIARCPAHDDRSPSLSISQSAEGKLLLHCFAGCRFEDILAASGEAPAAPSIWAPALLTDDRARRQRIARRIWEAARPIAGTLVERYLAVRAVAAPEAADLRFAPWLAHPCGASAPAMVAAIRDADGRIIGAHRTWLAPDGARKAELDPPKAMLGAARGGFVRLAGGAGATLVAEGIETALSVAPAVSDAHVLAALSAGGLTSFPLSVISSELIIAADGDTPGRRAAQTLADRVIGVGRRVRILQAPDGLDWNDVACAAAHPEGGRDAA